MRHGLIFRIGIFFLFLNSAGLGLNDVFAIDSADLGKDLNKLSASREEALCIAERLIQSNEKAAIPYSEDADLLMASIHLKDDGKIKRVPDAILKDLRTLADVKTDAELVEPETLNQIIQKLKIRMGPRPSNRPLASIYSQLKMCWVLPEEV